MNIKLGDVFFWSYKEPGYDQFTYWCKDQRAVAVEGRNGSIVLVDIYWGGVFKTSVGQNDWVLDSDKVDLEFICNTSDIRVIREYEVRDYDKVYNLSNQKGCCKVFAVDKESQVSNNALLKKYQEDLADACYRKRSAESDIEGLTNKIKEINQCLC